MRNRAYRRHVRARQKARHLFYYYQVSWISWNNELEPPADIADRHPADCGKSRCHCCHWDKLAEPRRERCRREAFVREWVASEGW